MKKLFLGITIFLMACGPALSSQDRNLDKFIGSLDAKIGSSRKQAFPYVSRDPSVQHQVVIVASPMIWNLAKQNRKSLINNMWKIWATHCQSEVSNIDHCRVKVVDTSGQVVGGSRAIAGSVVYAK